MLTAEAILDYRQHLSEAGYWYIDLADGRLVWSEPVYRIHGLSAQAPQPDVETAIAYYPEPNRQRLRASLDRAPHHGEAFDFVARVSGADGVERHVRTLGERIEAAGAHPGYLLGVFQDISEEALDQRLQRRMARALAATAEGIIITDPEGRMIWCNDALLRLSGYGFAELEGRRPGEMFYGPDTDPETMAYIAACFTAQQPFVVEVLNYARNGETYWIRLSVHPDRSQDGELLGYTGIHSDITEEKTTRQKLEREIERRVALEAELRHLSSHDALSGLANRRHFMDHAHRELERCRRHGRALSLVLFDMDDFKTLNDTRGHAAGDAVIRAVGELCAHTLRENDLAGRIGGEEFTLLLPETDRGGAARVAERLRRELAAMAIPDGGDGVCHVTASFGLAEARPEPDSVDSLLARADHALYSAKRSGRNRIASETPPE